MEYQKNNKDLNIKNYEQNISKKEEEIEDLKSELSEKNIILSRTKSYLFDLEYSLNNANDKINTLESDLFKRESEINTLKTNLTRRENEINNLESNLNNSENQIHSKVKELKDINNQIKSLKNEIKQKNDETTKTLENQKQEINTLTNNYYHQLSKLDSKEYCIKCYKEKIKDNNLEIEYLKKNTFTKKLISPLTSLYLLLKSKPGEFSINHKLYKALKNSPCFDIGYYLNNNPDIVGSKWCKYFSPELHYVCKGFGESRKFNKKYFNRKSKKELLDYISKCQ